MREFLGLGYVKMPAIFTKRRHTECAVPQLTGAAVLQWLR